MLPLDQGSGPWGNLKTLEEGNAKLEGLLTGKIKEILNKSNPIEPKGRIWAGNYPGHEDPEISRQRRDTLVKTLGIRTIICLQEDHEARNLEQERPYQKMRDETYPHVKVIRFPIRDVSITGDTEAVAFLDKIIPQIIKEEITPVYVHCWGGNGRTGTIVSPILAHLFNLDAQTAMDKVDQYHSLRKDVVYTSPETEQQCEQVKRITPLIMKSIERLPDVYGAY